MSTMKHHYGDCRGGPDCRCDAREEEEASSTVLADWCVVCQGGDEISEPVLLQDELTEAEARKIADASTQSMWAITMAWPKARYDAWKKHRAELWARMRGNAPEKLVIYSTPNGGESPFYRAWMDSQKK